MRPQHLPFPATSGAAGAPAKLLLLLLLPLLMAQLWGEAGVRSRHPPPHPLPPGPGTPCAASGPERAPPQPRPLV